jgi:hypothetical protein
LDYDTINDYDSDSDYIDVYYTSIENLNFLSLDLIDLVFFNQFDIVDIYLDHYKINIFGMYLEDL